MNVLGVFLLRHVVNYNAGNRLIYSMLKYMSYSDHTKIMSYINSHQISLFISMAKSPSLSMSTGEDLAFLGQEHRVELAKDHLQEEECFSF